MTNDFKMIWNHNQVAGRCTTGHNSMLKIVKEAMAWICVGRILETNC